MKIIALAAITLDGKIARTHNELVNWTSKEDKQFFAATTKEAGVLILGKTTFDTFPKPLPGRLHIVLTRDTKSKKDLPGSVEYTSAKPKQLLASLENRGFHTAIVAGGASIYTLFLKEHVIDELWLTVEPKLFGNGVALVSEAISNVSLQLLSTTNLSENVLLLKYATVKS